MVETQIQRYCTGWVPVEISRGPEISTGIDKKKYFWIIFIFRFVVIGWKHRPLRKLFGAHKRPFWPILVHWEPTMRKIPIFGCRYILKYGSNRKSKHEFRRAKIGQRTRFWGPEGPRTHLDTISGPILTCSEFSKTQYFHYFVHWRACRNFYGPKIFKKSKSSAYFGSIKFLSSIAHLICLGYEKHSKTWLKRVKSVTFSDMLLRTNRQVTGILR